MTTIAVAGCPWRCRTTRRWLAHRPEIKVRPGIVCFENGIGAATTAARLVDNLKATIAETMENIRIDCAAATTDLVTEIECTAANT